MENAKFLKNLLANKKVPLASQNVADSALFFSKPDQASKAGLGTDLCLGPGDEAFVWLPTGTRADCSLNRPQFHRYHGDRGRPPRFISRADIDTGAGFELHLAAWPVRMLPYLDQRPSLQKAEVDLYFGPIWANLPHSGFATGNCS